MSMYFKHRFEDMIIVSVVFFMVCLVAWGVITLAGVKMPEVPKHQPHRRHPESMRLLQ